MDPLFNNPIPVVCLVFCLSLICKSLGKDTASLVLLISTAFLLRIVIAFADPFLHDWDEHFHALVARNLMDNPLKPLLRKHPLFGYDYTNWTNNHIWLHKQPLFLWQMAASMKIFGVSEFTIRYPSIIMGTLIVLLTYRISLLLLHDKNVAYISATLICFSSNQLLIIAGYGIDHNDVAFCFYILLSFWAYAEYVNNKSFRWVVLIGVFSGCAVMNKWLTGLLVYAGWGINVIALNKEIDVRKEIKQLFISLGICCAVFLPWQIYIHLKFPKEAEYEQGYNARHIFEVVERHDGNAFYYLDKLDSYWGSNLWIFLATGLVLIFFISVEKKLRNSLIFCFLLVLGFFSVIVKTKMPGYILPILPIGFILIAVAVNKAIKLFPLRAQNLILLLAIILLSLLSFDSATSNSRFNPNDPYRIKKIHNTAVYRKLKSELPPNISVVFNANAYEDIDIMFYNNQLNVQGYCPTEEQFKTLADKNIPVAVFKNRPGYTVPYYIADYPYLYIIPEDIY